MKKFTALTVLFTVLFNMSGCASQPANTPQTGNTSQNQTQAAPELTAQTPTDAQIFANPFTQQFEDTDTQMKSMASNDSYHTVISAGPLYAGKESDQQPGLKRFRELKLALVDQIMQAISKADTDGRTYAVDLKALKDKYIDYLGRTLEQNKKLGSQMKEETKGIIEPEVAYTANFAVYKSTDPSSTDQDSVKALLQYQQVYLTLQNISLLSDDTAQTTGGLLTLQTALQNSGDANMKAIADDIEANSPSMVDSLGQKLSDLQQSAANIDGMLKQIDTAEYYMGQASAQYMQTQLADLNTKLAGLTPNANLTADDIAFMKNLTKYYGDFAGQIKQNLDQVDKSKLLSFATPAPAQGLIPLANAQTSLDPEEGYGSKALGFLTSAAKATYNAGTTAGKFTWNAGKTLISGTKTAIGVTLDTMAATTQSAKDIIGGGLSGDSLHQIGQNIKDNFHQVADNYNEGRSGSDILTTAHDYFDSVEKAGGNLAASAVEKTIGKGWTSWAAGHVGKLTVNLFTSLGKGITAVANKSSTNGEIAEGLLDIACSFIGGSKVIATGSEMLSGSKQLLKNFGEQGFNFIAKTLWAGDVAAAKALREELKLGAKMTAKELEQALFMNASDIAFKEGMVKEMQAAGAKLTQELKGLITGGAKTIAENIPNEIAKNFKEFVKDEFENTLKGLGEGILSGLGDNFTKYFNNVVGNKIDDIIKELTKEAVDSGKIPGLAVIPDINDLAGHWGNGSMVITDVAVTDEFKKKAKDEGCDYTAIEQQKGKSVPLDLLMEPTSATGGNLTIKSSDGKPQIIPFTYADGVITAQYSEQGANINLNMNVSMEDGKIKSSGPMTIDYGNGGLKITASTDASKPAPGEPTPPKPTQPATPPLSPTPAPAPAPTTPANQNPPYPPPAPNDFANT